MNLTERTRLRSALNARNHGSRTTKCPRSQCRTWPHSGGNSNLYPLGSSSHGSTNRRGSIDAPVPAVLRVKVLSVFRDPESSAVFSGPATSYSARVFAWASPQAGADRRRRRLPTSDSWPTTDRRHPLRALACRSATGYQEPEIPARIRIASGSPRLVVRTARREQKVSDVTTTVHFMAQCTAPSQGHRTASGRANCPKSGGRGNFSSPYASYSGVEEQTRPIRR